MLGKSKLQVNTSSLYWLKVCFSPFKHGYNFWLTKRKGWGRNKNREKKPQHINDKHVAVKVWSTSQTLSIKSTLHIPASSTEGTVSKESYKQFSSCCHQMFSTKCGSRHCAASSVLLQALSVPKSREVVQAFSLLPLPLKVSLFPFPFPQLKSSCTSELSIPLSIAPRTKQAVAYSNDIMQCITEMTMHSHMEPKEELEKS